MTATVTALHPGKNRVSFDSNGVTLVGDLYLPDGFDGAIPLPGVVVAGSWTTVKEQMASRYARELAERGFAALAFDFRFYGESGGEPRTYEDPQAKAEDIRAAARFLASRPEVAGDTVGGLAVCASAGYMAHAITEGAPIASFVTVAAWLHDPATVGQLYGGAEGVARRVEAGRAARERYERTGEVAYVPAYDPENPDAAMFFPVPYYAEPERGRVPAWDNRFAAMSWPLWLEYDALAPAPQLQVPTLLVHSGDSAFPDNVRRFARQAPDARTLWLEGQHIDFYDQEPQVTAAADAAAAHFTETLSAAVGTGIEAGASLDEMLRASGRRVVEAFFAALEAKDLDRFLAVWAEDGVQIMPFAPEGFPARLEGKEAIRNQYGSLPESYLSMRFPREIIATLDPSQFVVRYASEIERKDGGRYDNTYVGFFTIQDGKLSEFTEYFNPLVLVESFGGFEALRRTFNLEDA